jgi:flagellar motor switch protein FliN/FliY
VRGDGSVSLTEALTDINLRVWAELGRTRLALGQALELPIGAVVDLDRSADAPVDLFVNGLCFGQGHLLVTDDGEWAIEVRQLTNPTVRKLAPAGGPRTTAA